MNILVGKYARRGDIHTTYDKFWRFLNIEIELRFFL